ncbi:MAG: TonB-dependent receptor plug domain-containing protein, partial [Candidatus Omnitrophica bacterium]|nr:TonB-dependent receptor plug domain-containing protein [Candidatus Omnitrophota bacterium]
MKRFQGFIIAMAVLLIPSQALAILKAELDTVVVSANRIEQDSYKVAGNVTVITREQIENSNAQSIPEILKEAQGVFVYDNNTLKSTTVDIRGFGDTATRNVLVLVNDRRVNLVSLSGPDLVQVPLEAVERIEIIRGAGSVLYGDNAVGGVINIITKKGAGDIKGKIGGLYGSYDTQGGNFEVSGEEKGFSYYLYSKYLDKRGYRQNSDELLKDHNARIGYQFNDNIAMDIEVGMHEDSIDLPGGLDQNELASLGRRGSADEGNIITTTDKYYRMTFDVTPWAKEFYLGDFVVAYNYRERDTFDSFGAFSFNTDRMLVSQGIQGKYIFDHTIFDKEVNFVTGVDYYEHDNGIIGSGSNSDDLTISKDEIGYYTFLQFELINDLFVNGGTRYYKAHYTFDQRNIANFEEQKPDEWVSMGGLKYEYAKGSNIHFNYQQTFRFLATDEWYSSFSGLNTDIEQQTGEQFEVGVKHNYRDKAVFNVTPYFIRNKNEIYFNPTGGSFGFGANENYDETERLGVELGARLDLLEFVDLDFLDKLEFAA